MKTICNFEVLKSNGTTYSWCVAIDFYIMPDFKKDMREFVDKVNQNTQEEVIDCIAVCKCDKHMDILYQRDTITYQEMEVMKAVRDKELR